MAGSCPGGNSTSTTGPMTWITLPTLTTSLLLEMAIGHRALGIGFSEFLPHAECPLPASQCPVPIVPVPLLRAVSHLLFEGLDDFFELVSERLVDLRFGYEFLF